MTDSRSGVLGGTAADAGTIGQVSLPLIEARYEEQAGPTEAFGAHVEDIRRRVGSNTCFLSPRLADLVRRRLRMAPTMAGAVTIGGLLGLGIRLLFALLATALVGQWSGIPWGRWMLILVFSGLADATSPLRHPPLDIPSRPGPRRLLEDWTALIPAIVRESDLQELAAFTRRWYRLPVSAGVGVAVAATMLLACVLVSPTGMGELPAGSIVLLAFLLYDFGEIIYAGNLFDWPFMVREAKYDHHLFWPSPVDSPEVRNAMRKFAFAPFSLGVFVTIFLVLALVLVSWDSPLVLPLAVGFVVIGYLTTFGSTVGNRASLRKIVQRIRDQRMQALQRRIDAFGRRFTDLSPQESQQLRDLLVLHNMIRDAPTTPTTTTHTLIRAIVGLIIPTVMFVVAVFGEVYAERILDAILP